MLPRQNKRDRPEAISSKWYHQGSNHAIRWLYLFELDFGKRDCLPRLLHRKPHHLQGFTGSISYYDAKTTVYLRNEQIPFDFAPPRKEIESRQKDEWQNQIILVVFGHICRLSVRHLGARNPLKPEVLELFFGKTPPDSSAPAGSRLWPHAGTLQLRSLTRVADVAPFYEYGVYLTFRWEIVYGVHPGLPGS